jgi:hypothetical protein
MFFKQTPTQINYNSFSKLRAKCKTRSKFDYNNYILKTQNLLINNPKLFWKSINEKKTCSSIPKTMSYNNCQLSGGKDIVGGFARYFSSVYDNNLITLSSTYHVTSPSPINSLEVNLQSCLINITDILN